MHRQIQIRLGLCALALAALLILVGIPGWISTPSNVRNIVLSPLCWPYVLAGLTGIIGLALLADGLRTPRPADPIPAEIEDPLRGYLRLAAMAAIMIMTMLLLPLLGMVWTSMAVFVATAFLMRTRHPLTAMACAILVPLVLYAFFAHVAGVAIPQGEFVRLP